MLNLIIVGNGFDLAHGLETSYSDFLSDLKEHNYIYENLNLEKNLLLSILENENKNNLWSDIESTYFDILINLNDNNYVPTKYKTTFYYESSKELNDEFEEIKKCLEIYLIKEEKKFTLLENFKTFFSFFKAKETVIINFNYTNTVKKYIEKLYPPENFINIHGELDNQENPIIFGYAADDEESKRLLNENDNNYVRNIKKFNYLFTQNEENLKQHLHTSPFYIFILGHSCGISDKLILQKILTLSLIHRIYPFYYKDINGYFDTMVNIDRIIDNYSKEKKDDSRTFSKLASFPNCFKMPQIKDENDQKFKESFNKFLNSIDYEAILRGRI